MVYKLRQIKNLRKRKKNENIFFVIKNLFKVVYLISFFLRLRVRLFLNSRLFFFFRIYNLFYLRFLTNSRLRLKSKNFLFFFGIGGLANCFSNLQKNFERVDVGCYITHSFRARNFFLTYINNTRLRFISAGMGKYYKVSARLRRVRHLANNFVRRIRKHFSLVYKYFYRFLYLIYKDISKRVMLSLRSYIILTKIFNKTIRSKWLHLSGVLITRKKVFGFMRGERKPKRRKRVVKRNSRYYY